VKRLHEYPSSLFRLFIKDYMVARC